MMRRVAVSVLGHMQEDEEVLPEVVGHRRQPGEAGVREAEVHHLGGGRARRLDKLAGQTLALALAWKTKSI